MARYSLLFFGLLACRSNEVRRFIAVGDTGRGAASRQYDVGAAMADKCKKEGCDFVLMLGDNFYFSGVTSLEDPLLQDAFETPYAGLTAPFFVVLGNHDYGGAGSGFDTQRADYQVQYSQRSKLWRMPARFYQRRESLVDLVGLDTTAMLFQDESAQINASRDYLKKSTARWRIAMGHHPYLSNGPHGDAGQYDGTPGRGAQVKAGLDEAVCGKADLYLAGHDHDLQALTETCNGTTLIVSGAGSDVTPMKGTHAGPVSHAELGFFYFVATDDTLRYDAISIDKGVLYSGSVARLR